jgi:UDP-glucuronate decarboxylase
MTLKRLVLELTGSRSEIQYGPLPSDDPTQRCPDISLARSTLDWEPRTPLDEGLKHTIDYFDDLLREARGPSALGRDAS